MRTAIEEARTWAALASVDHSVLRRLIDGSRRTVRKTNSESAPSSASAGPSRRSSNSALTRTSGRLQRATPTCLSHLDVWSSLKKNGQTMSK
jgi:hypothetical protein